MEASPWAYFINLIFKKDKNITTSVGSMQLQKHITNQTEEGRRHSNANNQGWNLCGKLDFGKEKPALGSNRALLSSVIIVCLISLTALLLLLLMPFGKISPANEGQCTN